MSLRDDLQKQSASDSAAALKQAADETYQRWAAEMKKAPAKTRWQFYDSKTRSAVAEVVKQRFKEEGYTVSFQPARSGGTVEIIDDEA